MRLLVYLAIWQRPEITEICFMGLDRLRKNSRHSIEVLTVISEEWPKELCNKYGFKWTEFPNEPLGRKKNHGLDVAMTLDWDYLIETGSDDLLKDQILEKYDSYFGKYDMFGTKDTAFLDSKTGRCNRLVSDTIFGNGRCMSRRIFEDYCYGVDCKALVGIVRRGGTVAEGQIGFFTLAQADELQKLGRVEIVGKPRYKLWRDDINRGLDNSSGYFLFTMNVGHKTVPTEKPLTIDIKSDVNIWPFSDRILGKPYSIAELLDGLSIEEQTAIISLLKRNNKRIEYAVQ